MSLKSEHRYWTQSPWYKLTAALATDEIRCSWNPERSLPCTQQPTNCSHIEPDTSSPHSSGSICEQN